jgi:hypothetical protein
MIQSKLTKTLHLNLIKYWFEYILKGVGITTKDFKRVEYREITPYWCSKLLTFNGEHYKREWWLNEFFEIDGHKSKISEIIENLQLFTEFKKYKNITFSNGYAKSRPQFIIELNNIEIGVGKKRWGAEKDKQYFCLNLGNVINN